MGTPVFRYIPLEKPQEQIRLLEISAGTDIIELTIRHHNLEDRPKYVALSYEWGIEDEKSNVDILLNEGKFQVRKNLGAALEVLRRLQADGGVFDTSDPKFWVDALCINQIDAEEKGFQLNLMGRLFYRASQTIAWLGAEDLTSDTAMRLIRGESSSWLDCVISLFPEATAEEILAFKLLCQRSYFSRLWIAPEVMLSRNLHFLCGNLTCSWGDFSKASLFLERKSSTVSNDSTRPITHLRYSRHMIDRHLDQGLEPASIMGIVARVSENRFCERAHDRIYAFLGLFQEGSKPLIGFEVDYELPIEELMIKFAEFVNKDSKDGYDTFYFLNQTFKLVITEEVQGKLGWYGNVSEVLRSLSIHVVGGFEKIASLVSHKNYCLLFYTICWVVGGYGVDLFTESCGGSSLDEAPVATTTDYRTSHLTCVPDDRPRRLLWEFGLTLDYYLDSRSYHIESHHRTWKAYGASQNYTITGERSMQCKNLLARFDKNFQLLLQMRDRVANTENLALTNGPSEGSTQMPAIVEHTIYACPLGRQFLKTFQIGSVIPERTQEIKDFLRFDDPKSTDLDTFLADSLFNYYRMDITEKSDIESRTLAQDDVPVQSIEFIESLKSQDCNTPVQKTWVASLYRNV